MPVIRFEDAPRTENVQGRHVRHCSRTLGSAEILMGRTTKDPGPCAPYIHKHDHEDVIVMLRGSFTLRVADEEVTIREGDTLIIPPGHRPHARRGWARRMRTDRNVRRRHPKLPA